MNHYTGINMGINAWHGKALVIAFLSSAFGILFGIAPIILGKKTMSRQNLKWHMLDSG